MIRKLSSGKYRLYSRKSRPADGPAAEPGHILEPGSGRKARARRAVLQASLTGMVVHVSTPDVVMLIPDWRTRTLLRAQLIEGGHEVAATNSLADAKRHLAVSPKPRVVLVDLHGLETPGRTLDEICRLAGSSPVVVITALATLDADAIRGTGARVIKRPAAIGQIAAAVSALIQAE